MSDNTIPPSPEEMGAKLDEDIKETVQDWADNPDHTDFNQLDEQIDVKIRKTIAGWIGAPETASWKEIGLKMDANTRESIGTWVGADKSADWTEITNQIDTRVRSNIAKVVHANREGGETSWADIGAKIENDVRGWLGGLVGTSEEADWQTIGNQMVTKVRDAVESVTKKDKSAATDEDLARRASRIEIESDENNPPTA